MPRMTVWLRVDDYQGAIPLPAGIRQVGTDLLIENPTPEIAGTYKVTVYLENGQILVPKIILKYEDRKF